MLWVFCICKRNGPSLFSLWPLLLFHLKYPCSKCPLNSLISLHSWLLAIKASLYFKEEKFWNLNSLLCSTFPNILWNNFYYWIGKEDFSCYLRPKINQLIYAFILFLNLFLWTSGQLHFSLETLTLVLLQSCCLQCFIARVWLQLFFYPFLGSANCLSTWKKHTYFY